MRARLSLSLLPLLFAAPAQAAPLLAPGLSARIDRAMADVARRDAPGCAVAVTRDGHVVHAKGYGLADLEHDVPITPDTVFEVVSISRSSSRRARILLLVNDGKIDLDLDADVRRYLPELPEYADGPITTRHLLTHTSSVRDYGTLLTLAGEAEAVTPQAGARARARGALQGDSGGEARAESAASQRLAAATAACGGTITMRPAPR